MQLFLIRHGEAEANQKQLFYGSDDYPLTENGRQQAMALRPLLEQYRFDKVFSSDLSRAVETAQLAIPGCEPVQLPQLREFEMGMLNGLTFQEGYDLYGQFDGHYEIAGGESPQQVAARLQAFLDTLTAEPCGRVAAFCHSGILKTMMRLVLGMDSLTYTLQNPNCNIAVFSYINGSWLLSAWNLARDLDSRIV